MESHLRQKSLEETISPEIFVYFFTNSDPSPIQYQILTLILNPNLIQTLTETPILTLKKVNEKGTNEHSAFLF